MFFLPPNHFVAHPVSIGACTFREFDIAYKYVEKKYEIEERNKELLRSFPNLRPDPLPEIPRLTGDENEDKKHIFDLVDQFYRLNKLAYLSDETDDENKNLANIYVQNDIEQDESGYGSDSYMESSKTLSNDNVITIEDDEEPEEELFSPILLTEEIEMTLIFSFGDICIHLINGNECDYEFCESNHIFPTRQFILNKLINHTPEQIDKAYELVLRSKALKTKYLEVFNGFIMLRQE